MKRLFLFGIFFAMSVFVLCSQRANAQFYKIVNKASSKVIDASGSKPDNGTEIIQWEFNKGNNQL